MFAMKLVLSNRLKRLTAGFITCIQDLFLLGIKKRKTLNSKSASIIIINYNNDKYLHECIYSAINQHNACVDLEIIVVDDGSTDRSIEIINSFLPYITPILLSHGQSCPNFNQQRAFKKGLQASSGEIIFLLDGDDIMYPSKVKSIMPIFNNLAVHMVQHAMKKVDEDGNIISDYFVYFPFTNINKSLYYRTNKINFYQPTSGLTFRRSYLENYLFLLDNDEHHGVWLDVRLTRFLPYIGKIYSYHKILGAWRRHSASDSIRSDNIKERIALHKAWFDSKLSLFS